MTAVNLASSVLQLVGAVQNPATSQNPDGAYVSAATERNGSLQVSEVHGRYGVATARGNVFFASSALAGSVIKLSAATMTSITFSLLNPVGSGKNLELLSYSFQQYGSGTEIVTQTGLAFQTNIAAAGAPTSTTPGVINSAYIGGGGTSVAAFSTVATMTNSAIGSSFVHYWLTSTPLATTATMVPNFFDLAGQLVMAPGTMMTPVAALTGTEIEAAITVTWAEWPV